MIGVVPWIGGKRRLAPYITTLLPPHVTYVEPFAGGAQVFFHKRASPVEVLNDLDGEVVNFLRVLQQHSSELVRWLRFTVRSRALHEWFSKQEPGELTDIQRAARFLYLQKNSFGGRVTRQTFSVAVTKPPNYRPDRLPGMLAAAAQRLQCTQLECSSYDKVLRKFDRPTTVFVLDPPYIGRSLYRRNFSKEDFVHLATQLASLSGRFVLSINDHPLSRDLFGSFHKCDVTFTYTASRKCPRVTELLFANFAIPDSIVVGERIQIPEASKPQ